MARLVADIYHLTALIGSGRHGSVWRSRRRDTGEDVAVKLLHARYAGNPEVVHRLDREQHVLTAFLHPAHVRVRKLVLDGEVALVTELVNGRDLREFTPVPPEDAIDIATSVADALAAAHAEGVVHCDVKPSNILLTDGSGEVRITDSRVARLLRGYRMGPSHFADPRYAAPEVIRGGVPVPPTDIYGLGLVLYKMLTGTAFVDGGGPIETLRQHLAGLPVVLPSYASALREILEGCLSIDPEARPAAKDLVGELRRLRSQRLDVPAGIGHTHPSPRRPHLTRPLLTRRLLTATAVAALVGAPTSLVVRELQTSAGGHASAVGDPEADPPTAQQATHPVAPTEATADGATAFVRYWFEAVNVATATGDPARLVAASSRACQACAAAAKAVATSYQNGGTLQGGQYTVRDVAADGFFATSRPVVGVVYDRSPRSSIDRHGTLFDVRAGTTFTTCQIVLERVEDRWRVLEAQCASPLE